MGKSQQGHPAAYELRIIVAWLSLSEGSPWCHRQTRQPAAVHTDRHPAAPPEEAKKFSRTVKFLHYIRTDSPQHGNLATDEAGTT